MQEVKPRWQDGDHIGLLTVLWSEYKRVSPTRNMWVYTCRCSCGEIETLSQQRLKDNRYDCKQCMKRRKAAKSPSPRRPMLPEGVPDFARLPVPESMRRSE